MDEYCLLASSGCLLSAWVRFTSMQTNAAQQEIVPGKIKLTRKVPAVYLLCDSGRVSPRDGTDGRDRRGTSLLASHGMVGALHLSCDDAVPEISGKASKLGDEDEYSSKCFTRGI